ERSGLPQASQPVERLALRRHPHPNSPRSEASGYPPCNQTRSLSADSNSTSEPSSNRNRTKSATPHVPRQEPHTTSVQSVPLAVRKGTPPTKDNPSHTR